MQYAQGAACVASVIDQTSVSTHTSSARGKVQRGNVKHRFLLLLAASGPRRDERVGSARPREARAAVMGRPCARITHGGIGFRSSP